ncbi:glutamyl-tRNA reductase [Agromyces archimandritae]|uniref:Glutamyl-tRNA reductase n=1 Tax=Agromyces archimandritae TaxID=2781962 RepID=A0A975FM10_9MICO|nr:glutamyl-tRNA reductase [Agromyces archimandritae]QTX03436.1 glutamyl-tRNA reductase [Agromyces archimandritae]
MLICLTASHQNAGFDMLEKLQAASGGAARGILDRHPAFDGAVVVATCNRFEAYLDLPAPEGASPVPAVHAAIGVVGDAAGLTPDELRATFGFQHGNAVAEHLFSVAAGLESVVVGEGEIAGQVRRSLEAARAEGTTSPELERLFQRASQTSRRVKNETALGGEGRSLVRLALDLAESRIDDWAAVRVLLVGTGRFAGASLAALRERGVTDVRVYSPSGRGAKFAASHELPAVARGDYAAEAAAAELIVACSTVDRFVVDAALLETGRAAGIHSGLHAVGEGVADRRLLLDLGLPRNIDPAVADLPGVELLDLETIKVHAPLGDFDQADAARQIVHRAARTFGEVAEELDLAPALVALRSHVFDILDAEIDRARSRGDDGTAEAALRHMAGVLLHTPMARSREYVRRGEARAWVEGLEALFGVRADAAGDRPADAAASEADDEERPAASA